MNDIVIKAIQKINPTAEVSVSANDINQIIWENGTTPISKADIEAKMVEVQADYNTAAAAATNKKASGKAKLKALGLDDEEIKSLGL